MLRFQNYLLKFLCYRTVITVGFFYTWMDYEIPNDFIEGWSLGACSSHNLRNRLRYLLDCFKIQSLSLHFIFFDVTFTIMTDYSNCFAKNYFIYLGINLNRIADFRARFCSLESLMCSSTRDCDLSIPFLKFNQKN